MGAGESRETTRSDWRFAAPMMVGSALNPLNSSITATALVPIARAFDVSGGHAASLVAALYVASAIAQPAMGRVAEAFGPRRVFISGIILVLVGAGLGASATDLTDLVVARAVIGVGTSAGFPTAMLMIRSRADRTGASPGGLLGGLAISGQLTVVLGLPLGGLLVGLGGWRMAFLVNLPLALIALAMTWAWAPRDPAPRANRAITTRLRGLDPLGVLLFSGVVVAAYGSAAVVVRPAWTGPALLVLLALLLVAWERRAAAPFLDVRALVADGALSRTYLRTVASFLVTTSVMYGYTQWLQESRGMSATAAGLAVLPITGVAALVSAPVARRNLVRAPLLVSAVAALLAAAGLWFLDSGTTVPLLVGVTVLAGLHVGLATVGNQAALYVQAPVEALGTASGFLRTSVYLGSIGSATVIGSAFGNGVTDGGLHTMAVVLLVASSVLLALTAGDRRLPWRVAPPDRVSAAGTR